MKFKLLLIAFCMILINQTAMASRLPDDFWAYLKKQFPNATQRFDSLVVLSDGTTYIPLYPAQNAEENKAIQVEYTYPAGKSLASKPEVIIFNNNYVLLKLMKDKNGNFSITKNEDLPLKVKLGVMPQDMLVPVGLEVPESMKLILGDLVIPQKGDNLIIAATDAKFTEDKDAKDGKNAIAPLNELRNKKTLISTDKSKFVLIYNGENKNSLYEMKLNGLPSKILASNKSKFALVMYFGSKTLEIVDLTNERMVSQINLDNMPKDADLDTVNNIAYVASANASTIYMIDLNSAKLMKAIKLEQAPNKIAVSNNGEAVAFSDRNTQKIYSLKLEDDKYVAKYIAEGKNLSRILYKDNKIYTISRTENKLSVYNEDEAVLTAETRLHAKPVDAVYYNDKIYILCADDNIVDIYDTKNQKIAENVILDNTGFYSKITIIPNQPNALITGIQTKKFLLLNLDKMVISKKQNANIDVSNIIIVDNAAPAREETGKDAL